MIYVAMGIDLSLRSAGFVALPATVTSPGAADTIVTETFGVELHRGASELARMRRLAYLQKKAIEFWKWAGQPSIAIEEYAFNSRGGDSQAHALGEAGGVVKLGLTLAGSCPVPIVASHARKLLLGAVPRGSRPAKTAVKRAFEAAGFVGWTDDEYDAACVANCLLSRLGYPCFASAPVERKRR